MKRLLVLIVVAIFIVLLCSCSASYTVTLDYGYSTSYWRFPEPKTEEVSIEKDDYYSPPRSTRENYTFQGWYKDSACTVPWVNGEDKVVSDITLYAKWEEIT